MTNIDKVDSDKQRWPILRPIHPSTAKSWLRKQKKLLDAYSNDYEAGSLNYKWDCRQHLNQLADRQIVSYANYALSLNSSQLARLGDSLKRDPKTETIVEHSLMMVAILAISSFVYVRDFGNVDDSSISSIIRLCKDQQLGVYVDHNDPELIMLSNIFNLMFKSARKNINCYDCGTVARGIFYSLLKTNRPKFNLSREEIEQFRDDYISRMFSSWDESVSHLLSHLRQNDQSGVYVCGLRFGDNKFGHIFVIEKKVNDDPDRPMVRIFQSALNSYLLIDYVEHLNYLIEPHHSINLYEFENDMKSLGYVNKWTTKEIGLFIKWFCFYPQSEIDDTKPMRVSYGFVSY